jgi:Ca2+-binding EF-hand superfamily protein
VDENGDKKLTYNEFRKACRDFTQVMSSSSSASRSSRSGFGSAAELLSDSDIRYLFNFFDKNGDGSLSYLEVVSSLQVIPSPLLCPYSSPLLLTD